jgi:hypothetical protein
MAEPVTAIVTAGVAVGSAIGGTVASISDANKRRLFGNALSRLSADRQKELDDRLLRAKTLSERLTILTNAVTMIKVEEARAKIQGKQKEETRKILLIVGGGVVLLIAAFLIKKL